jgi:hypothetical protein
MCLEVLRITTKTLSQIAGVPAEFQTDHISSLKRYSGKSPPYHWAGGWVGSRAGLDDMESRKILPLPELELRPVASRYTDLAIPGPVL